MTDTVLVAGASGRTGRRVLGVLAGTDYGAVAATRDESKRAALREAGADEVRVGDLLDERDVADLLAGCAHVIVAVGSGPSVAALTGGSVDGVGVENLAAAAEDVGVERVVLTSSIGVGDSKEGMPLTLRALLWPVLRAKARGERAVREADVTDVVLRPGGLTDAAATGDVLVAEGGDTIAGSIPRADVARLLVASLDTPGAWGRTFEVVARDGLRGEAEGVLDVAWRWPDVDG